MGRRDDRYVVRNMMGGLGKSNRCGPGAMDRYLDKMGVGDGQGRIILHTLKAG